MIERSRRLIIRKLSSNDLNDFREIITQKEVARMAGFAPVSSLLVLFISNVTKWCLGL